MPLKWTAIILGLVLFCLAGNSGCQSESRPKGILSEKVMVRILMDIYIVEDKASRLSIPYDSMNKLFPHFRAELLKRSGVSDSTFKESWNYYMSDPKKMEYLYAAVVDSLNLREQSFSDRQKKDNATPD